MRIVGAVGLFLLVFSAAGQVPGDYDGDGDVDGDDFWFWAGCMTGPGASFSDPNCAAFDFDLSRAPDGKIDLADFAQFGRHFTGPPCTAGHKYATVQKSASATGCKARIRTRSTTLCGEPSAKEQTASAAWAGAVKFQGATPAKWGQIGYSRRRLRDSTTILVRWYAETKAGPDPTADYNIRYSDDPPSEGTHEYKCYLISSLFGTWRYEYDETLWYQWTHNGWKNETATDCQWSAEIWHKQNQMVGTPAAKCDFTECGYATNWGAFQDADIADGDLHTDDPNEWGIERTSGTAFNVWDKKP